MYIEWQDKYAIGIERIDKQHQQVIKLINRLYQVIGPKTQPADAWSLLEEFNQYAEVHFMTEERIAEEGEVPYDELVDHKAEHENYRQRIRGFRRAFNENDKQAPVQLMAFLSKWWLNHILVKDMELGRLISENQSLPHG